MPHGAPVLLEVLWEVDGRAHARLEPRRRRGGRDGGPAAGSRIDFVFDRRLDGARIEDTVDGKPVPKANPPITRRLARHGDTVMSDPPFAADVFYNSLPDLRPRHDLRVRAGRTSRAFRRPRPITFSLDPNGLTSVYGEPMDGPTAITVTTGPLTVTLPNSTATVPTSYRAADGVLDARAARPRR